MAVLAKAGQWLLWLSVIVSCVLTFVWPYTVSPDPVQPGFKVAAIATFAVFFAALLMLLAERLTTRR